MAQACPCLPAPTPPCSLLQPRISVSLPSPPGPTERRSTCGRALFPDPAGLLRASLHSSRAPAGLRGSQAPHFAQRQRCGVESTHSPATSRPPAPNARAGWPQEPRNDGRQYGSGPNTLRRVLGPFLRDCGASVHIRNPAHTPSRGVSALFPLWRSVLAPPRTQGCPTTKSLSESLPSRLPTLDHPPVMHTPCQDAGGKPSPASRKEACQVARPPTVLAGPLTPPLAPGPPPSASRPGRLASRDPPPPPGPLRGPPAWTPGGGRWGWVRIPLSECGPSKIPNDSLATFFEPKPPFDGDPPARGVRGVYMFYCICVGRFRAISFANVEMIRRLMHFLRP